MVQLIETFAATVLQRVRPGGKLIPVETRLPATAEACYRHLEECGFRITAEALPTGEISVAVEHPRRGAIACDVVAYGSPIAATLLELVLEFDACCCGDASRSHRHPAAS